MIALRPYPEVPPGFTDEALANEETSFYKGAVRAQLLRLPAHWRQTALAEESRRTTREVERDGLLGSVRTGPPQLDRVVDEIPLLIGRQRREPNRS